MLKTERRAEIPLYTNQYVQSSSREAIGLQHLESSKPHTYLTGVREVVKWNQFIQGENLGMEQTVKGGAGKSGKFPGVGPTFSFRKQELQTIFYNLQCNSANKHWMTKNLGVRDPQELPNNGYSALAMAKATERTLRENENWAKIFTNQISGRIKRAVMRKLSSKELENWVRPKLYLSHLAISNQKASSTPMIKDSNPSQIHKGMLPNFVVAKGPDLYIGHLLGALLLKWGEREILLLGDIREMYNSIHIEKVEQHCHRFLSRDLEERLPDTCIIQRVSMGDCPAAAISTEAIYKTAELFESQFSYVACLLQESTYVDDIIDSVETIDEALQLAKDTTHVVKKAGLVIKHWNFGGEAAPRVNVDSVAGSAAVPAHTIQALRVGWNPVKDKLAF